MNVFSSRFSLQKGTGISDPVFNPRKTFQYFFIDCSPYYLRLGHVDETFSWPQVKKMRESERHEYVKKIIALVNYIAVFRLRCLIYASVLLASSGPEN